MKLLTINKMRKLLLLKQHLPKMCKVFYIIPFYIVYLGIKYDAEKEARQLLEARQRELQRIEEAKQKIADQGKTGKN